MQILNSIWMKLMQFRDVWFAALVKNDEVAEVEETRECQAMGRPSTQRPRSDQKGTCLISLHRNGQRSITGGAALPDCICFSPEPKPNYDAPSSTGPVETCRLEADSMAKLYVDKHLCWIRHYSAEGIVWMPFLCRQGIVAVVIPPSFRGGNSLDALFMPSRNSRCRYSAIILRRE